MSSTLEIDNDSFLKKKDIQILRSQFLANHYASKSLKLRNSYDPKDVHGSRLSYHWKQGDTIFSVIRKKTVTNIESILNPDTYTKQSIIQLKNYVLKEKLFFMGALITFIIPLAMAHPVIKPRLNAIRRQMTFQYYLKSGVIARQLRTQTVKIPKQQMQKMINQANQKVGF